MRAKAARSAAERGGAPCGSKEPSRAGAAWAGSAFKAAAAAADLMPAPRKPRRVRWCDMLLVPSEVDGGADQGGDSAGRGRQTGAKRSAGALCHKLAARGGGNCSRPRRETRDIRRPPRI